MHLFSGAWKLVAVELFGEKETKEGLSSFSGIFKGGPCSFLGYQILGALCIIIWSGITTVIEVLMCLLT